eukprot:CAMPEP_0183352396 /NCGR_PEP_ID=MMETSP0164_2-20130417/29411_1 /TAXON_ID=221442 /ORGANISM="Coccolithus pelagicus ssp braarudi, Strain PLY182g" /LENGTH=139 /DNA_ID=CAMNT_0025524813 /DNA_START=9 /DNA_END=428 /DNA_ORIENTATION=+
MSGWPPKELTAPMDPHGAGLTGISDDARLPLEGPHASAHDPFAQPPQHQPDRLQEALGTAERTIDVGASILAQLGSQRATLLQARDAVESTDSKLGQANHLISKMFARARTQKMALYAIVLVLLIVIVLLIFAKNNQRR